MKALLTTPKVALIGLDRGWAAAPFDDPAWTIWAPVFTHHRVPRADVWFELHGPEWQAQEKAWCRCEGNYQAWLAQVREPVVMFSPHPEVAHVVPYPLETVAAAVGPLSMTGTIEWMAALAITLGATTIGYYGINYTDRHEEYFQRPGADYWIGYARGRGLDVVLPAGCPLGSGRLPGHYGLNYPPWPLGTHPDEWAEWRALMIGQEA